MSELFLKIVYFFKSLWAETFFVFQEMNEESRAFREQEPPLQKPVEIKKQETALVPSAVNQMEAYFQAQKECAVLASHIALAFQDFPDFLNIQPCTHSTAIMINKIAFSVYEVKFWKKDPNQALTNPRFRNELQPELNQRMEQVRFHAQQELADVGQTYVQDCLKLDTRYSCYDPTDAYAVASYNIEHECLDDRYCDGYNKYSKFYNVIDFFGFTDDGPCVRLRFRVNNGAGVFY